MNLNYSEGYYSLSFFNIVIETNEDLSKSVIENNKSTFIHEFMHYLQDLILTYNIRHNLSNVRYILEILTYARENNSITRPYNKWSKDSLDLKMQFQRTIGGITTNKDERFIDNISKIEKPTSDYKIFLGFDNHLKEERGHRVYKYQMQVYKVNNPIPINYNIGARDLLEYIAYKIEFKFFPDRPSAPQLPYKSIDLIFENYGLAHVTDDIRICIAERCLYNDAPIHFLFSLLKYDPFLNLLRKHCYKMIYNFLLLFDNVTRDGHREDLIHKSQRRLEQFAKELCCLYGGFKEIRKWILFVSDFVKSEFSGRFIFSDMYTMKNDEFFKFIDYVIHHTGVPLVMNSPQNYISIPTQEYKIDESQFIQFYILQKFLGFAESKEKTCPIFNLCKANSESHNSNCVFNSNKEFKVNENCYFSNFLKSFGLNKVKFD